MASREPRLDEIVWSQPFPQGIHSNSVLYYFADSPFFDRTSNNAVLINQGMNNLAMREFLYTREAFEGRLRSMSGLEFVVAQEPAETGPGAGTGVWVIRKQTRRKRHGEEDDITVHAAYFIVGEHIYMAPTLGDIFSSRVATISNAMSKLFPAVDSVSKWSAAEGRVYQTPPATAQAGDISGKGGAAKALALESREGTPMPDVSSAVAKRGESAITSQQQQQGQSQRHGGKTGSRASDARLAEESFAIHLRHGGDYMDENPITGKPGEFHLSSTGRKDKPGTGAAAGGGKAGGAGSRKDGPGGGGSGAKDADGTAGAKAGRGIADKSPRGAAAPKPKRRKSKGGPITPS